MIRLVALFSVLAAPLAAQTATQTAIQDRPGLWISVPRSEAPVAAAPVVQAPVLQAPVTEAPLITADPTPGVLLTPSEPGVDTAVLILPAPNVPDTRPVPRPFRPAPVAEVAEAPVVETAIVEAPVITVPVTTVPVAEVVPFATPEVAAPAPPAALESVTTEPVAADPIVITAEASARPVPRPVTDETVALAEALAAQIAAEAVAIAMTAPRYVPAAQDITLAEALAPVQVAVIPEVAARAVAPARVLTPPRAVPPLLSGFTSATRMGVPTPMSAVLLPDRAAPSRPIVQPVAFVMPPLDATPILPRLRPSGPAALDHVAVLSVARTAPLSAVLLPSPAAQPAPVPRLARSARPAYDPFPLSALPPSALPEGPYSLRRAIQPPRPFAEANAAVLTGAPLVIPVRLPVPAPMPAPAGEAPITDPEAAIQLPEPDANALARMMDDAMICWRMADLSVEAQWARLSVDVALDETNMPSAQSIRLTGFAHVVSGAAENAYRAAHSALVGCAEATANAPATTSATLVFDRNGVRLR